jgi:hypothetical protein
LIFISPPGDATRHAARHYVSLIIFISLFSAFAAFIFISLLSMPLIRFLHYAAQIRRLLILSFRYTADEE